MYTIFTIVAVLIIIASLIATVQIASNQKSEDYKSKTTNRFKNLLWIYIIGIGAVVVWLAIYIFMF